MLTDQQILRIPGPTPIPPSAERAMSQPMTGHRGKNTSELISRIRPGLKRVFGTQQEVMILTGSGTAGLEMAVVNTVAPGEEVLVIVTGAFGDRFAKICKAYGIETHIFEEEWGKAADPVEVQRYLQEHPEITVVFSTFCETSTGVLNPIKQLASAVKEVSDALIIVDGVSCVAGTETEMDAWGVDIVVTGSQKAFMLPPGLAFIAASKRAWKKIEANPQPRFYLDLKKHLDNIVKDTTPFTPAISILYGLERVLELFEEEGLEKVYTRHRLMMKMTRAAFKAWEIPLLANDEDASPTVTAVKPADFEAEEFRKVMKEEFALELAGGQQHLAKEIFRIGHMGYCSPADMLQAIAAMEIGLVKVGKKVEVGKGIQAAQQVYLNEGKVLA
ncbi:pyridoxal-phosphate-dependent aminotransferase family protein [Planococcus salinus]|uniref:Alanine--glyoxylate aminotransferase family protein n=1 Tax=Planococcus salinus TaxID=1848460 RepID=A0A3M8P964_9BACL|nr:alanine--glyoxylate aminotransferase family protein [Planococcus salinus]RNF40245.1 alanine--glyoxylate aminotransferase family protein [Planococcus salinus]